MDSLGAHTAALFLVKLVATALVVVAVSRIAERSGPFLASIVLTLPLFAGPAYFFMMFELPARFVAQSTLYAFAGTGPVLLFTVGFIHAVRRFGLGMSLLAGSLAWATIAIPLRLLPISWPLACAWVIVGVVVVLIGKREFDLRSPPKSPQANPRALWFRAGVAGTGVASVATLGALMGPETTGVIVSFPITLSVTMWMMERQYGAEFAAATLTSTQRTMTSYSSFCLVLALLSERVPSIEWAFAAAVFASISSAILLTLFARR